MKVIWPMHATPVLGRTCSCTPWPGFSWLYTFHSQYWGASCTLTRSLLAFTPLHKPLLQQWCYKRTADLAPSILVFSPSQGPIQKSPCYDFSASPKHPVFWVFLWDSHLIGYFLECSLIGCFLMINPGLLILSKNTTEETHLSHLISTGRTSRGRDFLGIILWSRAFQG